MESNKGKEERERGERKRRAKEESERGERERGEKIGEKEERERGERKRRDEREERGRGEGELSEHSLKKGVVLWEHKV
jgi:hypothetical protein